MKTDRGRSAILNRIRPAGPQPPGPELPAGLPEFPVFSDPVARFRRELEAVDGIFYDARRRKRLPAVLSEILAQCPTEEICWEAPEVFEKHGLEPASPLPEGFGPGRLAFSRHPRGGVELPLSLESRPGGRRELAAVQLSAGGAAYGIAETGTVVERVEAGLGRLPGVLPPCRLVFLSEGDLLMNLGEFFERQRLGEEGSAATFITGPSRTADIEKQLVLGVHGPRRWFVVLTG